MAHELVLNVSRWPSWEMRNPLWFLSRVVDGDHDEAEGSMGQPGTKTARQ